MLRPAIFAAAMLGLASCALLRRGQDECNPVPYMAILPIAVELAPGETLQLTPAKLEYGYSALPARCTARWSVRGVGVAISRGGLLTAARGAAVGDTFVVRAERGRKHVERAGRIVDPAPNPLAGAWRQRADPKCFGPYGPVGELIFRRGGEYLLTDRPFETQVGEVGTYTYDRTTRRLALRRGEQVRGEGTAERQGDRLVFTGTFPFAMAMPGESCRAVFEPIPMPNI